MSAPRDQAQRDLAVTWTDGPVLVEAGAGTGKTRLLVDRVVHLVRSGRAEIGQIAAITFTIKAAAELRERVRKGLRAGLDGTKDEKERLRLRAALEGIDGAQISTIHSFALRLLRERALEAGLAPGAGDVDLAAHEELRDRLWEAWLAAHFQAGDAAIEAFLSLGLNLNHLVSLRDALLELPELRAGFPAARGLTPAELHKKVAEAFARWKALADEECLDRSDTAYAQLGVIREWMEGLPGESAVDLLRALWRPSVGLNKRVGSPKKWTGERAGLKAFRDGYGAFLQEACAEAGQEILGPAVASLRGFAEELERAAMGEGMLTYQDILLRAVRLVRESPEARAAFRRRFAHFLVDEFQDTDPLQVELVFLLAGGEPCPADWRGTTFSGGGLFLVGDPKQAIYRFRRADIAVYEEAKKIVERSAEGRVLKITQNFRSAPGVIEAVNGIFSKLLMADGEFQAGHIPLEADRTETGARVFLLDGPGGEEEGGGDGKKAEARRVREAALLAAGIRKLVEEERPEVLTPGGERRPLRYGDAVLLFRARTGYADYEEAFRAAGVPVLSEGGRGFYARAEVAAAAAVLRAVLRPADPLALAAALRSPLYGFSDEDLARWRFGLAPSAEWAAAVEEIHALHGLRGGMSARALLGEIFARTRAFELFLASFQGEQRAANLLKLLDLAFAYEQGGARGAEEFGAFLDAQIAKGDEAREPEAAALDAQADAVRFLSMHAAKGLEFPLVALADLGGAVTWGTGPWIAGRMEGRVHLRLGGKDQPLESPGYAEAEARERRFAEAELLRLLYVAATRARDFLLVPLLPGKNDLWKLMGPGGVTPDALRAGDLGPVRRLEVEAEPRAEAASYFRLPPSAFEPDEKKIDEGRRRQEELAEKLDEMKKPPAWLPPLAPSRLAGREEDSPEAARYGEVDETDRDRSLALGTLVHALLARIGEVSSEELAAEAQAMAFAEGLGEKDAEEALALVRGAAAGDLLKRAKAAPRSWRELAFFAEVEGRLVRGFADLVFEEGDGLVIGDFKTDAAEAKDIPAHAERYKPQGGAYALCLEAASKKKVKEVVFAFLRPGGEHLFQVDDSFRDEARAALRGAG